MSFILLPKKKNIYIENTFLCINYCIYLIDMDCVKIRNKLKYKEISKKKKQHDWSIKSKFVKYLQDRM